MHDMGNMGASSSSSIMSMAASATMSMAAATATPTAASHDMSDMDMSGMSMSMGTFHWSSSGDGIWFDAWVPNSEGAYIGACFGLFFFAILSRGLPALEAYFIAWKRLRDNRVAGNQSVLLQPTVSLKQCLLHPRILTLYFRLSRPMSRNQLMQLTTHPHNHLTQMHTPVHLDCPQFHPFLGQLILLEAFSVHSTRLLAIS